MQHKQFKISVRYTAIEKNQITLECDSRINNYITSLVSYNVIFFEAYVVEQDIIQFAKNAEECILQTYLLCLACLSTYIKSKQK